ncbi:hypothetical protein EMPS_04965 [Entomortierella parvispora]|uniref:Uncharacterized protein n=1 Tax=Entomortierella parvispora TaxID=205924 RepID=A0A9P3LW13_9FUNG|nr:hypothetical protein EMPS_04965 [Entomortierella parvispora]
MTSAGPPKATPTSINYASLSSYLCMPSTASDVNHPPTCTADHIRSPLSAPPKTNSKQASKPISIQPAITPSAPSTTPEVGDPERQRLLRQNQEIIRLCSLKSIQIRQSETRLSQLESENIGLRATVNKMQRRLEDRTSHKRHQSPVSPSLRKRAQSPVITNSGALHKEKTARAVGKNPLPADDTFIGAVASDNETVLHTQLSMDRMNSGSSTVSRDALLLQLDHIQVIYEVSHDMS